jgi:gas vesicle protein
MASKKGKNVAIGAMIAAVAGFVAGILSAPKSGKQTRADIKKAATMSVAEAEKQLKKLHTQLNTLLKDAKGEADSAKGKAKAELDSAMDKAQVVREKTREALSAVHDGDVEDKDLKQVIDDATSAIEHLKAFVKKPN